MQRRFYMLLIIFPLLSGCLNNKKPADSTKAVFIHRIWEFKGIDTASMPNNSGSVWIGRNQLDLTNKDTLRFSYQSNKNGSTSYPYSIRHDTIFVQNKASYKILKLTANELDLGVAFKADKSLIVMIYKVK